MCTSQIMMTTKQDLVIFLIMVLFHSIQSGNVWIKTNETDTTRSPNVTDCEYQGICTNVTNYPKYLAKSFLSYFKSRNITKFVSELSHIEGGNINYENLCSDREKVIYPQAAKHINGTWKFILNGKSFQGFVVETCQKDCPEGSYISDYNLNCTQKYVYKEMVYLHMEHWNNGTYGTFDIDMFQVPTCCSCSLFNK